MKILRTPDERFANLPDFPYQPHYTDIAGGDALFRQRIPGAEGQPHQRIEGGGHFLQEGRGEVLARIVSDFVRTV